jgi:3-deoxy-D-manno-octulosonic acid (KDO) 8-phosphate synthase
LILYRDKKVVGVFVRSCAHSLPEPKLKQSLKAGAVGVDGIFIETHFDPANAKVMEQICYI